MNNRIKCKRQSHSIIKKGKKDSHRHQIQQYHRKIGGWIAFVGIQKNGEN